MLNINAHISIYYVKMGLPYREALQALQKEAAYLRTTFCAASETVPLAQAVNRISSNQCSSLRDTPQCDTSAMDGYAIKSRVIQVSLGTNASDLSSQRYHRSWATKK